MLNFFDDAFKKFTSDNDGSTILLDSDQDKPSSNLNNKILSLFLEDALDTYYLKGNAVSYTFSSILSLLSQKSEPNGESCYLSDIIEFNNKRYLCLGVMNIDNDGKCLIDQDHLRCYSLECGSDMRRYCLLLTREVSTNTISCGECVECGDCDNIDYDIQWVLHKSNNDVVMELYDRYSSFKAKNWCYIGSIRIVNPYGKLVLVSDDDIKNKLIDRLQQQMYPIRREIVEKKNKIRKSISEWFNSSKFDLDHENNQLNSQVPDQNQLNNDNATLTAQKSELQKEIDNMNKEKGQLNTEMAKLQEKLNELKYDNKDLQNKNTEFETKKNAIEKSIQQYESKLNILKQEIELLQETSRKLQQDTTELQNVKDDLEINNKTVEKLTKEIDNLKKANEELNKNNSKLKHEQEECDKNKQSLEELKKVHEIELNNLEKQKKNEINDYTKQPEEKINELNNVNAKLKLLQGVADNYRQIVYAIDEFRKNCGVVNNNSLNVLDDLASEQMCDSVKDILSRIQNQYQNYKTKSDKCSKYERLWNDLRRKYSNLESELQALRNQPKK